MFTALKNAFAIPELRKKMLYTLLIVLLFRIGSVAVPVPFISTEIVTAMASANEFASYLTLFTGGGFAQATLFALSISPYITASIIIQLLSVAIPSLEKLSKEGEEGRKKLGQITRITTVAMAVITGFSYYTYLRNGAAESAVQYTKGFEGFFAAVVIIASYTVGSVLMMWLAESINQKGIGNGISIILFAGIVANFDMILSSLLTAWSNGSKYYAIVIALGILILAEVWFVVFMSDAERRVPVQYAKRVVGRKMYGGQSTNIPIKVNMASVLPVIFANSILSLPTMLLGFGVGVQADGTLTGFGKFLNWFNYQSIWYLILYVILIIAFAYFYISITYNPIEIANNLRKNSGAIPGIRPGKPTSDYLAKIVSRITLIGAIMLAAVVLVPNIGGMLSGISLALGGTTVIIVVG
ncbi:MAG: preprotein translocase subunit SecY, partial [Clostridia bacterium]|nr:preprotein translocase subunit SecY [Clostridia bacterium]